MIYLFRLIILKVKSWYKSLNVRKKINTVYILLIVAQTTILTVFANIYISNSLVNNTISQLNSGSRLVLNNISNIMDNAESYSNDLTVRLNNYFINDDGVKVLYKSYGYDHDMLINKIFRNVLYVYHQVYGVMFITSQGDIITSDNLLSGSSYKKITDTFLSRKDNNCMWLKMGSYNFSNGRKIVLPYCKKIININTGDYIGSLTVMIEENTFSSAFSNIDYGEKSAKYFFCNNKGIIVSATDKSELLKPIAEKVLKKWIIKSRNGSIITSINNKRSLVTKTYFSKAGWWLVCSVPMEKVTAGSRKMSLMIILLGLLFLMVSVVFSKIISLSITRPLYRLINDVQNLNIDNLDAVTVVESSDDVGLLAKSFNSMKKRITDLIEDKRLQEEKQKKYELNLLQAQIKPHFFYNTLQLIYAMIGMNDKSKAQKAVKSLADFYRTALSNGSEIITIEKELANTEDYLDIQKIRYSDAFVYTVECDEEYKKYKIPKLMLQPIVENSVVHGLAGREAGGIIRITIRKSGDTLNIEIYDNGVGISQEKIAEIIGGTSEIHDGSFGIKNIDERIKLFYGYSYGLKISSSNGNGTYVNIYIPAMENFNGEDL